ncbi:ABC transporter substrate-binding protein [Candidatus Halobonum tyrrellensis]|nr:extracellular solute-binding protein [Candidatus Halobonum tyrrellensis]
MGAMGGGSTTVSILTWTGYGDVQDAIESELDGTSLDISVTNGSARMFSTMNSGGASEYDIVIPNNEYVPRMMEAGIAAPMPQDVVSNYENLFPRFKQASESQFASDGEIYGLPIRFGWYTYGFDSSVLPEDHTQSFDVLFSESYEGTDLSGKISMYDGYYKSMMVTALHLGYRDAFEGSEITLSDEQISEVETALTEQKSNVLGYVTDSQALTQSFQQESAAVAYTNRTNILNVQNNGIDTMRVADPEQPELTWFEGAVVSSESSNQEAAWEVLNQYISPEIGAQLAEARLIASTCQAAQENIGGEYEDRLVIDPSRLEGMIPFKPAAKNDAWVEAWQRVQAA